MRTPRMAAVSRAEGVTMLPNGMRRSPVGGMSEAVTTRLIGSRATTIVMGLAAGEYGKKERCMSPSDSFSLPQCSRHRHILHQALAGRYGDVSDAVGGAAPMLRGQ